MPQHQSSYHAQLSLSSPCRDAFDHVVDRSLALVAFLKAQGPAAVHNMDNLLLRESMDVIGVFLLLLHTCVLT